MTHATTGTKNYSYKEQIKMNSGECAWEFYLQECRLVKKMFNGMGIQPVFKDIVGFRIKFGTRS